MDIAGKTCLITGANSGIGKITARELAKQQAIVVMLVRNMEKGQKAREEIYKVSGNKNVHLLLCDLSSQQQVHEAAEQFQQQFQKLDILINNAGVILGNKRQESEDGVEMTFAINHLGHYSLSLLLLDLLKQSPTGRIITVSSESHRRAHFHINDLQLKEHPYNGYNAYCISKLCNIWFTRHLATLTKNSNLSVNCLHPGFVSSNFGKNTSLLFKFFIKALSPFSISPEKGAETNLYLAKEDKVQGVSGHYFLNKKIKKPSRAALNDHYAAELWKQSAELSNLDIHKVTLR